MRTNVSDMGTLQIDLRVGTYLEFNACVCVEHLSVKTKISVENTIF